MTRQGEETEVEEGAEGSEPETTRDGQEATGRTLTASPANAWGSDRETAREAGRRGGRARAEQRRRDREEAELGRALGAEGAGRGVVQSVARRTSAADTAIVAALEREAKKGDVQAARAVLDWRRLDATQGAGIEAVALLDHVSALPTAALAALRSMVLDLVRESQREAEERKDPAQQHNREGSVEADQSLPQPQALAAEPEATPQRDGTPVALPARTPQSASQSGNDPQSASDTADP